jgi:hypothetical protein
LWFRPTFGTSFGIDGAVTMKRFDVTLALTIRLMAVHETGLDESTKARVMKEAGRLSESDDPR